MAREFKKTAHKGLRYFEHDTRKHGKKLDRYYTIRFRLDGKLHTFGIGWLSDGIPDAIRKEEPNLGFEDYCLKLLRQYKGNIKTGDGPKSPKEKREIAERGREQADQERIREEKENITFDQFMTGTYFPQCKADKKSKTYDFEKMFYRLHLEPEIGSLSFSKISPFHLEKIKKTMAGKELSPRYVFYALQIIRQVFNTARKLGVFAGDSPTRAVKWPKLDNAKLRYLSIDEAETLLTALKAKSQNLHDEALLSLHCGLRFGEIAALPWSCVNFKAGTLAILNAKTGSRTAYLTDRAKAMLESRKEDRKKNKKQAALIFPKRSGKSGIMEQSSRAFNRTVAELGFNTGVTDRKQHVTFHTLRHTYATHLYESTHDLYLTQRSLGHATGTMTARYAKMSESRLREGAAALQSIFTANSTKKKNQEVQVVN